MQSDYLYGINPAFEVLRAGRRGVRRAFFGPGGGDSARRRKLTELLQAAGIPLERADKNRLYHLCGSSEHQNVVFETAPYPYVDLPALQTAERLLLLDNVEDPQNVGAILRSAEVFGWTGVLLSSRGVPPLYPSVIKASAGAAEHLRITRDRTANDYVKALLPLGFQLAVLDARAGEDLRQLAAQPPAKLLLVIGGEHRAVGQHIINQAHHRVYIPQAGRLSSLNASVAAGLALFLLNPPSGGRQRFRRDQ